MSATRERADLRLTVPAEMAHATLIRACLRDALQFGSDDHETSFLVAVSEIVVGAVEASHAGRSDADAVPPITVELYGPPDGHIVVSDVAGSTMRDGSGTGDTEPGLAIAGALLSDIRLDIDGQGRRVRLGLDGARRTNFGP